MTFITPIDGATALLRSRGVYRQTTLHHRNEAIYAKWGSGFLRLGIAGATSSPYVSWLDIDPGEHNNFSIPDGDMPKYLGLRVTLPKTRSRGRVKAVAAE